MRDSKATFEAIGRPDLHGVNTNYETVRQTLVNCVLDETPAKVEDVEMLDDYAAQGVIDEIPEVEARIRIPRKKGNKTKRRRRELVKRKVSKSNAILPEGE
jgi:hypothetical protein